MTITTAPTKVAKVDTARAAHHNVPQLLSETLAPAATVAEVEMAGDTPVVPKQVATVLVVVSTSLQIRVRNLAQHLPQNSILDTQVPVENKDHPINDLSKAQEAISVT
jgi:hypothetical protein